MLAAKRTSFLLVCILALCAAAQARNLPNDLLPDEHLDVPSGYATGFRRSLLAPGTGTKITVGYEAGADHVVKEGSDALPQLQEALDAVVEAGGGQLIIGPGTFMLSNQLMVKGSNLLIKGAGMMKTKLKLVDNAAKWERIGLISGSDVENITVSDFTLDGNKDNQPVVEDTAYGRYGLYLSPNDNLVINRLRVNNFQMYGIDPPPRKVDHTQDYTQSKHVGVTCINSVASFNNYDGFIFDTVVGVFLANCTAEGNGRYGINLVTGTWNAHVVNNKVINNGFGGGEDEGVEKWVHLGGNGCGMMTDSNILDGDYYQSTNIVWEGNLVTNSSRGGICSKGSKNISFISNRIQQARQCIWISNMTEVTMSNNTCADTENMIAESDPSTQVVFEDNTCDGKPCEFTPKQP